MPKIGCNKCEYQFIPRHVGVHVIEHAAFGPYKLWVADEWICPGCGQMITMLAKEPLWQDYQGADRLKQRLQDVPPDQIRHIFENPEQKEEWRK